MRSDNSNNSATSGGIGFLGLLAVAFIVLRLIGVIEWAWVWVLAPIWLPLGLFMVIIGGCYVFVIIAALIDYCRIRRSWKGEKP
jgi:hypothetical protein